MPDADARHLYTYWNQKQMNDPTAKVNCGSTISASPPPNYLGVSISQISNGYIVYVSGYHEGKSISQQVYAADADEIGNIVSLVFESPESL